MPVEGASAETAANIPRPSARRATPLVRAGNVQARDVATRDAGREHAHHRCPEDQHRLQHPVPAGKSSVTEPAVEEPGDGTDQTGDGQQGGRAARTSTACSDGHRRQADLQCDHRPRSRQPGRRAPCLAGLVDTGPDRDDPAEDVQADERGHRTCQSGAAPGARRAPSNLAHGPPLQPPVPPSCPASRRLGTPDLHPAASATGRGGAGGGSGPSTTWTRASAPAEARRRRSSEPTRPLPALPGGMRRASGRPGLE